MAAPVSEACWRSEHQGAPVGCTWRTRVLGPTACCTWRDPGWMETERKAEVGRSLAGGRGPQAGRARPGRRGGAELDTQNSRGSGRGPRLPLPSAGLSEHRHPGWRRACARNADGPTAPLCCRRERCSASRDSRVPAFNPQEQKKDPSRLYAGSQVRSFRSYTLKLPGDFLQTESLEYPRVTFPVRPPRPPCWEGLAPRRKTPAPLPARFRVPGLQESELGKLKGAALGTPKTGVSLWPKGYWPT